MIKGTGIDIEEISRFNGIENKEGLMRKCFTERETEHILSMSGKAQTAAGIFCAKEAFFKAAGMGIFKYPLKDIEVRYKDSGAPYFEYYGKIAEYMEGSEAFLSISHSGGMACAQVIIEDKEM